MEESSGWKKIEGDFGKFWLIMEITPPQYPSFPFIPPFPKQALSERGSGGLLEGNIDSRINTSTEPAARSVLEPSPSEPESALTPWLRALSHCT
jgi:hypothetical protein